MANGKSGNKPRTVAARAKAKATVPAKAPAPRALSPFEEMDVLFDRLSRGLMSRMGFPALGDVGWPFATFARKSATWCTKLCSYPICKPGTHQLAIYGWSPSVM